MFSAAIYLSVEHFIKMFILPKGFPQKEILCHSFIIIFGHKRLLSIFINAWHSGVLRDSFFEIIDILRITM